jgi:peptide subunit release factor 1 (eRF1)
LRSGVLVVDHAGARVFTAWDGIVEEVGPTLSVEIGKSNYGGYSGYEEHGVRSHAGEATARMWKEAGRRLLVVHTERPLDYLALGGQEEVMEELVRNLHPYLTDLPRTRFPASPTTVTPRTLRFDVRALDAEMLRQRHSALAGRVCDVAWSGGHAVLGLAHTLEAANAQAIDTLVVAGDFATSGAICAVCSRLARSEGSCDVCGSHMFGIEDVVAASMEVTIASGGKVQQVEVPSPLDNEGIGALTRFPLPV